MDILTSFLFSILQYSGEKYISKKREKDNYENLIYDLSNTMASWIARLPDSAYVSIEAFTPLNHNETDFDNEDFKKIQQVLENDEIPEKKLWENGLFKYWKSIKEKLGEEGTNFFQLDDILVLTYLKDLSKNLTKTCEHFDSIYKSTMLKRTRPDLGEIILVLKEQFRDLINSGELERVHSYIEMIRRNDDLDFLKSIKETLLIFETEISIICQDRKKYKILVKSLEKLNQSFERNYYLFVLNRHFDNKYTIDTLISHYTISEHMDELYYLYELKWNNNDIYADKSLIDFCAESRHLIAENKLNVFINTNNLSSIKSFIEDNQTYLKTIIAKLLCEISKLYIIENNKNELTVSENKQIEEIYKSVLDLESVSKEFNDDFKFTILRIEAICLFLLDNKSWKLKLRFIGDTINTKSFFEFLLSKNNIVDVYNILEDNEDLYNDPELTSTIIKILLLINEYDKLIKFESYENLSETDITNINIARKIIISEEKSENLLEGDIIFDDDNLSDPFLLLSISRIFLKRNKKTLAVKYFDFLYKQRDSLDKSLIIELALLAQQLNKKDNAIELFDSVSSNEDSLIFLTSMLMETYEDVIKNSEKLTKYFKDINIDNSSPRILRLKVAFLNNIGDQEQGIELLDSIANKWDKEIDWVNLAIDLVSAGKKSDIITLFDVLSKKESTPNIVIGMMFLSLFIGKNNETRLENFTKLFFELNLKFVNEINIPIHLVSKISFILATEQLHLNNKYSYVDKNTFIEIAEEDGTEKHHICIHDKDVTINSDDIIVNAYHLNFDNTMVIDWLYKKVDEIIIFKNKTFRVKRIDSLLHYPAQYLYHLISLSNSPELTGVKQYKIPDMGNPLESIMDELKQFKQYQDEQLKMYSSNPIYSLYMLAGRDYHKYIGAIGTVLDTKSIKYKAGLGVASQQLEQCVLSYSTILLLCIFDKMETINFKKVITVSTIINIFDNIFSQQEVNPEESKMSISVDVFGHLIKYESSKEDNIAKLKFLRKTISYLKKTVIINSTRLESELLPYVPYVGKSDLACIQIAKEKDLPLIIDDNSIQILSRHYKHYKTSNMIPFYWRHSNDNLKDKLLFLSRLSDCNYEYVLYPGIVSNCVEEILNNENLITGPEAVYRIFIDLIKNEFERTYKIEFKVNEILNSLSLVVYKFLISDSELIFNELLSLIDKKHTESIIIELLKNFNNVSHVNFIQSCHSKFE